MSRLIRHCGAFVSLKWTCPLQKFVLEIYWVRRGALTYPLRSVTPNDSNLFVVFLVEISTGTNIRLAQFYSASCPGFSVTGNKRYWNGITLLFWRCMWTRYFKIYKHLCLHISKLEMTLLENNIQQYLPDAIFVYSITISIFSLGFFSCKYPLLTRLHFFKFNLLEMYHFLFYIKFTKFCYSRRIVQDPIIVKEKKKETPFLKRHPTYSYTL